MDPSLQALLTAANTIGVVGFGTIVARLFWQRKIRLEADVLEQLAAKDKQIAEWKAIALRGLSTSDKAVTVAAAVTRRRIAAAPAGRRADDPQADPEG